MPKIAEKTDPALWEKVKKDVTKGSKGGQAGQWSARKAQMAVAEYKQEGGGYKGRKSADNHLTEWTGEDWGTRSGNPSGETGERYLPKAARKSLSAEEYDRTTARKRADTRKGRQFSRQPGDVARKTAVARHDGAARPTKAALMAQARQRNIPGRSRMSKDQLARALEQAA
jgi:methyl coenzyme M reductase gamma subunit